MLTWWRSRLILGIPTRNRDDGYELLKKDVGSLVNHEVPVLQDWWRTSGGLMPSFTFPRTSAITSSASLQMPFASPGQRARIPSYLLTKISLRHSPASAWTSTNWEVGSSRVISTACFTKTRHPLTRMAGLVTTLSY